LEISDKALTEFVIELAKQSDSIENFSKKLEENGAEFPSELCTRLFNLVKKMLPLEKQGKFSKKQIFMQD